MTYKLNQGSNAQGDWAELLSNDTKLVRVETKAGEKPVIQVLKPEVAPVVEPIKELPPIVPGVVDDIPSTEPVYKKPFVRK